MADRDDKGSNQIKTCPLNRFYFVLLAPKTIPFFKANQSNQSQISQNGRRCDSDTDMNPPGENKKRSHGRRLRAELRKRTKKQKWKPLRW